MMSKALSGVQQGAVEVEHLLQADPTPRGGLSPRPDVTRAVVRAAVVLLSSHLDRYLRSVTDEAVAIVNKSKPLRGELSLIMRLEHSRVGIANVVQRSWEKREDALGEFVEGDAWLWKDLAVGELRSDRLLTWMKSPKPASVLRLYRLFGIEDIFGRITRARHTRDHFFRTLGGLVNKRNDIAHGDFSVEVTRGDLQAYLKTVREFCRRADGALARSLNTRLGIADPWGDPE